MMRRAWVAVCALILSGASVSFADMIEVRGKGVMNGTVVSQDDRTIRFTDSSGNEQVIEKKDVLFMDAIKDNPVEQQVRTQRNWSESFSSVKYKVDRALRDAKKWVRKTTQPVMDFINKPLDRTNANTKARLAAKATADAAGAAAGMGRMAQKINKRLGQNEFAKGPTNAAYRQEERQRRKELFSSGS